MLIDHLFFESFFYSKKKNVVRIEFSLQNQKSLKNIYILEPKRKDTFQS